MVASGIFRSRASRICARLISRAWCKPLERKMWSLSRSPGGRTSLVCRILVHSNVPLFTCQCTSGDSPSAFLVVPKRRLDGLQVAGSDVGRGLLNHLNEPVNLGG